jgi:hypothetical protein
MLLAQDDGSLGATFSLGDPVGPETYAFTDGAAFADFDFTNACPEKGMAVDFF